MKLLNATTLRFATLVFFWTMFCMCGTDPKTDAGNISALAAIKKEPKVKEAIISDANVLYVSVEDDGNGRNGYASYLCQVLIDHKASCDWVKVVEFGTSKSENRDNAFGRLLGESRCSKP